MRQIRCSVCFIRQTMPCITARSLRSFISLWRCMAVNRARNNTNNNGVQGAQGMNGARSTRLTGTLLEQIRALGFVKVELELYLDTHPNCRTALDYYRKTVDELERLTEEYHNQYGPLVASGNLSTENWNWINGPWPWQNEKMNGNSWGRE
ncbi:MAG: spore coat protein CotJB [Ruminococcaceae bacterium]|nr:spore coat protein CotJB [Oscillospiraceae bacterium]